MYLVDFQPTCGICFIVMVEVWKQTGAELCQAQVQLACLISWAYIGSLIPKFGFNGRDILLTNKMMKGHFTLRSSSREVVVQRGCRTYFRFPKTVFGSTRKDLQMLESKFCSFQPI